MFNVRVVDYVDAIPSWSPAGASKLPLEVVKELYPEYVLWGPEPQKFIDVVDVFKKVVNDEVNCDEFLRGCKESQMYSVEPRLRELQNLDGDIAYRADYMIEKVIGNNLTTRIYLNRKLTAQEDLPMLFAQLQTTLEINVKSERIIHALYGSVIDEELGSFIYPSYITKKVASAYKALKLKAGYLLGESDVV